MSTVEDSKQVVAAREMYMDHLLTTLTPFLVHKMMSMYESTTGSATVHRLRAFQDVLRQVPQWNQRMIDAEVDKVTSQTEPNMLEDLVATIMVSNAEILSAINLAASNSDRKINLKIPKFSVFLHNCYIELARKLFRNVYLLADNRSSFETQKAMQDISNLAIEAIKLTIQKSLPIHDIIKQYVTGGGDDPEGAKAVLEHIQDPQVATDLIEAQAEVINANDGNEEIVVTQEPEEPEESDGADYPDQSDEPGGVSEPDVTTDNPEDLPEDKLENKTADPSDDPLEDQQPEDQPEDQREDQREDQPSDPTNETQDDIYESRLPETVIVPDEQSMTPEDDTREIIVDIDEVEKKPKTRKGNKKAASKKTAATSENDEDDADYDVTLRSGQSSETEPETGETLKAGALTNVQQRENVSISQQESPAADEYSTDNSKNVTLHNSTEEKANAAGFDEDDEEDDYGIDYDDDENDVKPEHGSSVVEVEEFDETTDPQLEDDLSEDPLSEQTDLSDASDMDDIAFTDDDLLSDREDINQTLSDIKADRAGNSRDRSVDADKYKTSQNNSKLQLFIGGLAPKKYIQDQNDDDIDFSKTTEKLVPDDIDSKPSDDHMRDKSQTDNSDNSTHLVDMPVIASTEPVSSPPPKRKYVRKRATQSRVELFPDAPSDSE